MVDEIYRLEVTPMVSRRFLTEDTPRTVLEQPDYGSNSCILERTNKSLTTNTN
jgi:hypothetical protein